MARFIWFTACIMVLAYSAIMGTFNELRMQDLSRTTSESATCHVQAENFALDALDMNLEVKHKHEGVAVILDKDVSKVKAYVEEKVANFDSLKSDVEDLDLSDVFVYQGTYGTTSSGSGSGDHTMVQDPNELPYYSATLTGKIKRVVRGANDKRYIEFTQPIFVRASHIPRR